MVKPYDDQFALATSSSEMTADKPACTPLALALNQLPLGEPQADLTRSLDSESQGAPDTYVTLTTYAQGEAQAVLADVKKAVAACGDGFTAKGATAAPCTSRSRRRTSLRPRGDGGLLGHDFVPGRVAHPPHPGRPRGRRRRRLLRRRRHGDGHRPSERREAAAAVVKTQSAKLG
ncbi:hypothetical protein ACFQV4_29985 [Streptomyces thermocarboxydus]